MQSCYTIFCWASKFMVVSCNDGAGFGAKTHRYQSSIPSCIREITDPVDFDPGRLGVLYLRLRQLNQRPHINNHRNPPITHNRRAGHSRYFTIVGFQALDHHLMLPD